MSSRLRRIAAAMSVAAMTLEALGYACEFRAACAQGAEPGPAELDTRVP